MERPKLKLVQNEVPPLERERPRIYPIRPLLGHLATMQSLPDNVYLLRPEQPTPPEAA